MIIQILINGLLQGVYFGLLGVSFALVYRTTKVFNLALGGLYVLAPFIMSSALRSNLPVFIGISLSVVVPVIFSLMSEEIIHWPLSKRRAPPEIHLISSLGGYLVIVQAIVLIWGNETHALRQGMDTIWRIANVTLSKSQLGGPSLAAVAIAVLFLWLGRANRGLELRALADNQILVALLGRNLRSLRRVVFGLSASLVAIASLGLAWDVGFDPYSGLKAVLVGMVAMIIGGNGSFAGPFIGGILLGVLRAQVAWYGSSRLEEAMTFLLLVIFIFLRPQGIFALKTRLEEV